jgi:hypothetical protein
MKAEEDATVASGETGENELAEQVMSDKENSEEKAEKPETVAE